MKGKTVMKECEGGIITEAFTPFAELLLLYSDYLLMR